MKILPIFLLTSLLSFSNTARALEKISPEGSFPTASGAAAPVNTPFSQTFLPPQTVTPSLESASNSIEKTSPLCLVDFNAEQVITLRYEKFLPYYHTLMQQLKEDLFAFFLERAEQGDPSAEFYIGNCHETGIPFGKVWDLAAQYYSRAAKKGFFPAHKALHRFLDEGKASYLPIDDLKKLASQGNQAAIEALNEYLEGLSNYNEEGELEYWEEEEDSVTEFLSEGEDNEEV